MKCKMEVSKKSKEKEERFFETSKMNFIKNSNNKKDNFYSLPIPKKIIL